jgi:hypothetical protein
MSFVIMVYLHFIRFILKITIVIIRFSFSAVYKCLIVVHILSFEIFPASCLRKYIQNGWDSRVFFLMTTLYLFWKFVVIHVQYIVISITNWTQLVGFFFYLLSFFIYIRVATQVYRWFFWSPFKLRMVCLGGPIILCANMM